MVQWLTSSEPGFEARFKALLGAKREADEDVSQAVTTILAAVEREGDAALMRFSARFDHVALLPETLQVSAAEIMAAAAQISPAQESALRLAAERIEQFHIRHRPHDDFYNDALGVTLGARWTPVDAAGIYVPGGTAAYPSTVLMNAIPARAAGVRRIVMATPAPNGVLNPLVLAAASLAGVHEVYRVGGAQAIAALAYGTQTIAPVDVIAGPGNAYVAAAKRIVYGRVGIDSIAGPSEVVILADSNNDPAWLAWDLLAQAEHDTAAQSILFTDDAAFAKAVSSAVDVALDKMTRAEIARASWRDNGAIIVLKSLEEAPSLIDRLAPEHLQIATAGSERWASRIRHAGAIFLGAHTPEAIGDYLAGPNHVLPTSRTARFSSGLSVLTFMKRTTIIGCGASALSDLAGPAITLAEAEGLSAHAMSIRVRTNS